MFDPVLPYLAVFSQPAVMVAMKLTVLAVLGLLVIQWAGSAAASLIRKLDFEDRWVRTGRRVVRGVLLAGLVLWAVSVAGIGLQGLWSFLTTALTLVAIGFIAVWSVLSNFVCALLIFLHKPFQIGDFVAFPNETVEGTVVDFALAYTSIRHADGTLFRVPNNQFFQKSFSCRPVQATAAVTAADHDEPSDSAQLSREGGRR